MLNPCHNHLAEDAADFLAICIVADAEDSVVVLDHGRHIRKPAQHLFGIYLCLRVWGITSDESMMKKPHVIQEPRAQNPSTRETTRPRPETNLEVKLGVDCEVGWEEARCDADSHEGKTESTDNEHEVSMLLRLPPQPVLHRRDGEEEEETEEELVHALLRL